MSFLIFVVGLISAIAATNQRASDMLIAVVGKISPAVANKLIAFNYPQPATDEKQALPAVVRPVLGMAAIFSSLYLYSTGHFVALTTILVVAAASTFWTKLRKTTA